MPERSVETQASDFALRITRIAKIFGGENTPEFQSDIISGERGWLAEIHNNQQGFNLTTDEEDSFLVRAEWSCSSDRSGQWLKINQSSFAVFLTALPKRPLFRYDFVSDYSARIPQAHIHFHADHPTMQASQALQDAQGSLEHLGSGSQRARRKVKHRKKIKVSDLHFPVGGTRLSVSSYLCVGLFLQVFVEAVGVGHSHLVDGLFPAGNPGSFDESASGSGGSFAFLGPPSSSFIFNIADHQPQRLQR